MCPPSPTEPIRVLFIEDDEDDFILTRGLLAEIPGQKFTLDWQSTYDEGLRHLVQNAHDVCLVDYRLGAANGIELLGAAMEQGCQTPTILLTGQGDREIDLQAMKAGAADYLVKGRLDARLLERSIRYAIERKRAALRAAAAQRRLAAFGAEVGLALTRRDSLRSILHCCAAAMVKYLDAALARIWTFDSVSDLLRLEASAGVTTQAENLDVPQPRVLLDVRELASGKPVLINRPLGDPRLPDQEFMRREGLLACAHFPLVLEERLVGLMSLFARDALPEGILPEMGSVANGIALCMERKRSEEALGVSEDKYRSVVENVREVIFQMDQNGCWTFLNPAWTEITGFKLKDSLGCSFVDFVHPEDRQRHRESLMDVIERTRSYCREEVRYLAIDGTFRWVEVYAQPMFEGDGVHYGASGTLSDITERKRAEAEIQKLAAFARFNPDPVMELAADGTLTYFNQAAREMAQALKLEDPEAILPPDAAHVARECLRTGQSELRRETPIHDRMLSWSFFPIIGSQVVHCYGVDITERLSLEAQLRHAQKLESIGQLAAGVAHDFNNILTIIRGHTDRLTAQASGDANVVDSLKQVSEAARRGAALTRQLLMFSRKQVMQTKVLDLNAVLGNLTKMLQRLLGDDIKLESRCGPRLPTIEGDMGMIEQVLMNLAVNSRDAMPKGGRLVITTSAVHIDEVYVRQHPEARAGEFVCLSVEDTGCGMSKEVLDRVFEPFFTTKEVGKGTGLGLATVYGIVKQHQGWIEVTSEVNVGTTFKIFFSSLDKPAEPVEEFSTALFQRVRGGQETILLVEDEPVLRDLARVILNDYAYEVLEASSGTEALQVFEQHGGRIDLLLTDMVMPEGMSGRELAEELKSRKPDLKVVFTSGYSAEVMGRDLALRDTMFLPKPYPPPLLAQTVRTCLDLQKN